MPVMLEHLVLDLRKRFPARLKGKGAAQFGKSTFHKQC
jgi:hypothetical protein